MKNPIVFFFFLFCFTTNCLAFNIKGNSTICEGSELILSIEYGKDSIEVKSFQWRADDEKIDAFESTLSVKGVKKSDSKTYTCLITYRDKIEGEKSKIKTSTVTKKVKVNSLPTLNSNPTYSLSEKDITIVSLADKEYKYQWIGPDQTKYDTDILKIKNATINQVGVYKLKLIDKKTQCYKEYSVKVERKKKEEKKDTSHVYPKFLFSLGTNVDLIDGVKLKELYADVNVDIPYIFNNPSRKRPNKKFWEILQIDHIADNLGVEFGVYRSRSISRIDSLFGVNEIPFISDTTVARSSFKTEKSQQKENLGVFVQPKVSLTPKNKSDDYRVSIFGHVEWVQNIFDNVETTTVTNRDTQKVDISYFERFNLDSLSLSPPLNDTRSFRNVEHNVNIGAGMELLYHIHDKKKEEFMSFHLKGMVAKNFNKSESIFGRSRRFGFREDPMYIVQFEILETKAVGAKFGVEVRGIFNQDTVNPTLDRSNPSMTIYIAKLFNFKKIADFLAPLEN